MGQKVHPEAMRVGYIHDWKSNWFTERDFSDYLAEDVAIREHITNKLAHAGLSDITIRKDANEVEVNIHTARPGIVIGKSGSEVDALRRDLHKITKKQSGRKRDRRPAVQAGVLVEARARYVRTSARKARLVCDHIRGKDVEQARAILSFTPRGAAKPWLKLLESAIANAEHNHELVGDELKIASIHADEGPTLKRYRPRAMGRATRIRKRTSHLTITLTPKE